MELTSFTFLRKAFLSVAIIAGVLMVGLALFGSYQITHANSPDDLEMVVSLQKALQIINVLAFCCFMIPAIVLQVIHGRSLYFLYALLFFIFFNNLNLVWLSGKYTARVSGKFVMVDYLLFVYYIVVFIFISVVFFIGSFLIHRIRKKRSDLQAVVLDNSGNR